MSTELILLAVLMFAVTYPSRALPLLAPGSERLPAPALRYLGLVGPAVLASLAAVNTLVAGGQEGPRSLHLGVEVVGVVVCIALTAWRRNLFLGLVVGVAIVALARAAGA